MVIVFRRKNHVAAFLTIPKNIAAPQVALISVTQEKIITPKENPSSEIVPYKYEFMSLNLGG